MSAQEQTAAEWLEANGPRDEAESRAAARALLDRRETSESLAAVDALTEFERQLMEIAWAQGQRSVREALEGVIGSAAETLSATALRQTLAGHFGDVNTRPDWRENSLGPSRGRDRAASIVRQARDRAQRITDSEALR